MDFQIRWAFGPGGLVKSGGVFTLGGGLKSDGLFKFGGIFKIEIMELGPPIWSTIEKK